MTDRPVPLDACPLVSIITPTKNQAGTLAESLRSIRAQTHPRVELIVVDGGSTDETLEVLERLTPELGCAWISEPDGGMYDALNKGLQMASGDVVGYLNSDDVLLPWAVEEAVGALDRNPDADLVFGDALCVEDGRGTPELRLQIPFRRSRLARFGSLVQPSVFWRRSVGQRVGGFDADLRYVGDLDYWLRLSTTAQVVQVSEVLSIFRVHPDAQSVRWKRPMRAEEDLVRQRHHADGRWRSARKLVARLEYGVALRLRMLAFATTLAKPERPGWRRFRKSMRPALRPVGFVVAMLPIVGRWFRPPWLTFDGEVVQP